MNRYGSYKPSNIVWIGEIPEHWSISKVGRHLKLERGRVISNIEIGDNPGPYPVYSSQTKNNGEMGSLNTYDFDGEYVSWTTDGANAGTCFHRLGKFNVTNVCGLLSSQGMEIDYKFLSFFLSTGTKGYVRQDINPKLMNDMMSEIPLLLVPIHEQKLISHYLDKKTSQIDSLVEKIQKKIELLKEQRTSLINHYVTKGLDPNVEMNDSGVEWIGEIPKHWTIVRLRFLCDIKTGGKDTQDNVENGSYPFFVRSPNVERINSFSFDGEAVLTSGDGAGVGKIFHYYVGKFDYHQRVYKFSNFKDVSGKYFYWFLKENFQYEILRWNAKSTVDSVRLPFLQNFPMVLPPIEEQENLLLKIDSIDDRVEKLIQRLMKKIEILKEYRQSLISSVVTGKVRVTEDMI